jgi:hypothetical protein
MSWNPVFAHSATLWEWVFGSKNRPTKAEKRDGYGEI